MSMNTLFSEENIVFMLNKCKAYAERLDIEWNNSMERIILRMMEEAEHSCTSKSVSDINTFAFNSFTLNY